MDERFTYMVVRYLDNDLKGAELAEFNKYLEKSECREYLEKARFIEDFIKKEGRQIFLDLKLKNEQSNESDELKKQVEEDFARYDGSEISPEIREKVRRMHENMLAGKRRKRIAIYAALAAVVVAGLFFFWPSHPKPSPRLLHKEYYKTFEFITTRDASEAISLFGNAYSAYTRGDYNTSARLCREIIAGDTSVAVIHFLYGLSLMEMDSMQSALQQFRTTTSFPLKKGDQVYVSAHWYESLCWLSLGRPDSALAKLEVIRGGDNLYVRTFKVEELEEEIRGLERNE